MYVGRYRAFTWLPTFQRKKSKKTLVRVFPHAFVVRISRRGSKILERFEILELIWRPIQWNAVKTISLLAPGSNEPVPIHVTIPIVDEELFCSTDFLDYPGVREVDTAGKGSPDLYWIQSLSKIGFLSTKEKDSYILALTYVFIPFMCRAYPSRPLL